MNDFILVTVVIALAGVVAWVWNVTTVKPEVESLAQAMRDAAADRDAMRAALSFYADPELWRPGERGRSPAYADKGHRARITLEITRGVK